MGTYEELKMKMIAAVGVEKTEEIKQMALDMLKEKKEKTKVSSK